MKITKTPEPVELKLDLSAVRVTLYSADAHADEPNQPRVIVNIPGKPEGLTADVPLSDVLTPKQVATLAGFQDAFVKALLAKEGFVESDDGLADGKAATKTPAA
jgi:hypothetical protein